MLIGCDNCHREYVAAKKDTDEHFICSRCQGRTRDKKTARLGLHPALERKLALRKQDDSKSLSAATKCSVVNKPKPDRERAGLSELNSLPKIPGFEIAYQIGRGAMGSVYRARLVKTGHLVAIKVLAYDLSERADLVARFEREAYALKSLSNPNVVSVIDAGRVNDIHYFAMEFIDGITLRARINQAPIKLKEACFITSQILNGLKAAHSHGIIHRDLKPENVLLTYEDRDFSKNPTRVVLVDFGLVGIGGLAFDPHPNLTRSRVTMGTVNYMAPEQHVDAKRVDHRSDLYSAGVILFEMLTKELPIGRYLLPYERNMDVPAVVDDILAKALSRTVEQRYASADRFIDDLSILSFDKPPLASTRLKPKEETLLRLNIKSINPRWALLFVVAFFFIAFGIKLSKSHDIPASAHNKKAKASQS